MKKLIYIIAIVCLAACNNPGEGGSSAPGPASGSTDWSGYEMLDIGSGLQHATKVDGKGVLVEEGTVSGGAKSGNWLTYHSKNGIPATITGYSNGAKNGAFVKLNDRGNFEEVAHFANDKLNGPRQVYDRTRVVEESNYKAGQLHGSRKLFYKGGEIKEEGTFKNGKRDGVTKWYDEEGNVTIEMTHKDGKEVK